MSTSHHGGGHRRKRHDNNYRDDGEMHDTAEQKLKHAILRLGEVDPEQEVTRLATQICEQSSSITPTVVEAFRIGVTEQPFKIPYYAMLLRLLSTSPAASEHETLQGPDFGKQILEDFWKGFQAFLDKLAWREIRLCIHFFAHLSVAQVISLPSMYDLIRALIVVLDEFGVSHGRAKHAVRCVCEGLMIAGRGLENDPSTNITDVVDAVRTYIQAEAKLKRLVRPVAGNFSGDVSAEVADEFLESALSALEIMRATGFPHHSDCFPRPYSELAVDGAVIFDLPSVLVPPEVIELDGLSPDNEDFIKKAEWAEFYIHLFDNDVTPDPTTPVGYTLRCGLLDVVDIFEVNRKECARLLLEYPKWTLPGTFHRAHDGPHETVVGKNWQLECTIIEVILGQLFLLPEPAHKSVYYISLITELCKLSPHNVGPAVGKSIRKMYNLLSDGLDVALADRVANWFSIHMSNFNFIWVWKEWIEDLNLPLQHPKRVFMRRAVEYEIRLSYYDRIVKTLPDQMQSPDACVVPPGAPGPAFEYDDPASAHHDAAQSVLNLFRGRARAEDVMTHLEELKNTLETTDSDQNINTIVRSIAVQALLHIGSRSFSHFLNAIERYLPLLRNLAAGGILTASGSSYEARNDILSAVLAFWKHNKHMVVIVLDKLMQYQIVDPTDVITWAFLRAGTDVGGTSYQSCNSFQWDLIKGALDKANGRVAIARRKLAVLRKEDDDNAARAKANDGATMDIDETKPDPVVESPALAGAVKAFTSLTREQKAALTRIVDGFYQCIVHSTTSAHEVVNEKSWNDRNSWSDVQWSSWETCAWYLHFCRTYAPYLRVNASSLESTFEKPSTSSDAAAELFKQIWDVASGQEE